MNTTLEVEVMYDRGDPATRKLLKKRVGLMAASSLPRHNVLMVIVSRRTTADRKRETVDGNLVERAAQVRLINPDDRAILVVRKGEFCLEHWVGVLDWTWHTLGTPFMSKVTQNKPIDMPQDALIFYPPSYVSQGKLTRCIAESNVDMF